ncbi:hypothetical protein FHR99_000583 [Litorivivens lipolytica]|uniref:Flagellar hook-length control protein-like C-terminal domain-containing protein n=1 Tax=Litorivivens lipolytica TaxID=1524264 RepID=A0A7W4W3Q9_9GAMM|nr:hypothetical protein [Litorivivens lipolytica]
MNFDKPLYITGTTLAGVSGARQTTLNFRVGAILDVMVARQNDASSYTLNLGRHQLNATSELPLTVGKRAHLQVMGSDAQGRPALRPLSEQQGQVAVQLQQRVASQQSAPLRQALQIPTTNTFAKQALEPLLAVLPQREDVMNAGKLRQTLLRSGLFLEALLARGQLPQGTDLKALLVRLAGQHTPQPAQTAQTVSAPPPNPNSSQVQSGSALPQQNASASPQQASASQGQQPPAKPTYDAPQRPSASTPQPPAAPRNPNNPQPALPTGMQPRPFPAAQSATLSNTTPQMSAANLTSPLGAGKGVQVSQAYQQAAPSPASLKSLQLGQFLATMESRLDTLPQLLRVLESSVNRIESQQLASLQAREQGQAQWLLDLPVRNGEDIDYWQFFMRQENAGRTDKQQKEKRWLVTLSVELWAVGKLAIHIDHGDSRTAIRLFSENPEVLDWVAKKSPVLQAKLSKAGIENSEVEGHFGALPDSLQPQVDLPGLSATA